MHIIKFDDVDLHLILLRIHVLRGTAFKFSFSRQNSMTLFPRITLKRYKCNGKSKTLCQCFLFGDGKKVKVLVGIG